MPPRARPDSVSTQRIELGSFERDFLKDASLADNFAKFYDALFGSPTKLIATTTIGVATIYAAFPSLRNFLDENVIDAFLEADDIKGLFDWVKDLTETQNLIAGAIGGLLGGPFGFILSQILVEGGEKAVAGIGSAVENFGKENVPVGIPITMILSLKQLERKAKDLL